MKFGHLRKVGPFCYILNKNSLNHSTYASHFHAGHNIDLINEENLKLALLSALLRKLTNEICVDEKVNKNNNDVSDKDCY